MLHIGDPVDTEEGPMVVTGLDQYDDGIVTYQIAVAPVEDTAAKIEKEQLDKLKSPTPEEAAIDETKIPDEAKEADESVSEDEDA